MWGGGERRKSMMIAKVNQRHPTWMSINYSSPFSSLYRRMPLTLRVVLKSRLILTPTFAVFTLGEQYTAPSICTTMYYPWPLLSTKWGLSSLSCLY